MRGLRRKQGEIVVRLVVRWGAVVPGVEGGEAEAVSGQVVEVGPGEVEADGVVVQGTGDEGGSTGAAEGIEDNGGAHVRCLT